MKGNLTREEQDELSAKLAAMGVDMTWNGEFSELDFDFSSTKTNTYTACRYVQYLSLPASHIFPRPHISGNPLRTLSSAITGNCLPIASQPLSLHIPTIRPSCLPRNGPISKTPNSYSSCTLILLQSRPTPTTPLLANRWASRKEQFSE